MRCNSSELAPRARIPQFQNSVAAAGREQPSVRAEREAKPGFLRLIPAQCQDRLSTCHVDHPRSTVLQANGQALARRVVDHPIDGNRR